MNLAFNTKIMNSYFYTSIDKTERNAALLEAIKKYAEEKKKDIYVLDRPLTDQKYSYNFSNGLIVLTANCKIAIVNDGGNSSEFEDYIEDIIEDIGSISDKYLYKDVIGRPRTWRDSLINTLNTPIAP